jgi:hypothetical protein
MQRVPIQLAGSGSQVLAAICPRAGRGRRTLPERGSSRSASALGGRACGAGRRCQGHARIEQNMNYLAGPRQGEQKGIIRRGFYFYVYKGADTWSRAMTIRYFCFVCSFVIVFLSGFTTGDNARADYWMTVCHCHYHDPGDLAFSCETDNPIREGKPEEVVGQCRRDSHGHGTWDRLTFVKTDQPAGLNCSGERPKFFDPTRMAERDFGGGPVDICVPASGQAKKLYCWLFDGRVTSACNFTVGAGQGPKPTCDNLWSRANVLRTDEYGQQSYCWLFNSELRGTRQFYFGVEY